MSLNWEDPSPKETPFLDSDVKVTLLDLLAIISWGLIGWGLWWGVISLGEWVRGLLQ